MRSVLTMFYFANPSCSASLLDETSSSNEVVWQGKNLVMSVVAMDTEFMLS